MDGIRSLILHLSMLWRCEALYRKSLTVIAGDLMKTIVILVKDVLSKGYEQAHHIVLSTNKLIL